MGAGRRVDQLLAVVGAARKFIDMNGGRHPTFGSCSTDHYDGIKCDCGYEELKTALKNLEPIWTSNFRSSDHDSKML